MNKFFTNYNDIVRKIESINPVKYAGTRNYKNGNVTRLSPYISRGVISTRFIYNKIIERGISLKNVKNLFKNLLGEIFGNKYG